MILSKGGWLSTGLLATAQDSISDTNIERIRCNCIAVKCRFAKHRAGLTSLFACLLWHRRFCWEAFGIPGHVFRKDLKLSARLQHCRQPILSKEVNPIANREWSGPARLVCSLSKHLLAGLSVEAVNHARAIDPVRQSLMQDWGRPGRDSSFGNPKLLHGITTAVARDLHEAIGLSCRTRVLSVAALGVLHIFRLLRDRR